MIPIIPHDKITFTKGSLHTNFQRTGLSKAVRISPVSGSAQFSVSPAQGDLFVLTGPSGEIERFRLEKHALSGLNRIASALAANPDGRWASHYRYTILVTGVIVALAIASHLIDDDHDHSHPHGAGTEQVASAVAGYEAAMAQPPAVVPPAAPAQTGNAPPPTKRAIYFGPKNAPPEKTLYVFSDPQCPHCRELERTLSTLPAEYAVHVFVTPFLPGAEEVAAKIHCASDPKKAWRETMAGGTVSGNGVCDKASWGKENIAFFRSVGLTATPTIVAGVDGRLRTGATDLPSLLSWMKTK